jgi:hypothetical protein
VLHGQEQPSTPAQQMARETDDEVHVEQADVEEARVDLSYVAPQVHENINVALHREYSLGIVFIFSLGRKDLYHV